MDIYQNIIDGRIASFMKQIADFEKQLAECERRYGKKIKKVEYFKIEKNKINSIFEFIENNVDLKEVDVNEDYYWSIPRTSMFDVRSQKAEVVIGSLHEDIEFLNLDDDDEELSPMMLMHAAPVLLYLAASMQLKNEQSDC